MAEQKRTYQVKPGYRHGAFGQYGPGATVELTEAEAKGFLDKLELVGESVPSVLNIGATGGLLFTPQQPTGATITPSTGNQPAGNKGDNADAAGSEQPDTFNVVDSTIDEVLAAVGEGKITAANALIAEQQGSKKRATLIAELTKLVGAESQPTQE